MKSESDDFQPNNLSIVMIRSDNLHASGSDWLQVCSGASTAASLASTFRRPALAPAAAAGAVAAGGCCQRPAEYCGSVLWGPTTLVERSVGLLEVVDGRGGICKKRSDDGMSSVDFVTGVLYRSSLNGLLHSRKLPDDSFTFSQLPGSLYRQNV